MKHAGVQFHEGIPELDHFKSWFPKGGLLALDDLIAERGEEKALLDLFTKHSHHQNITVLYMIYLVPRHVSTRQIRQEYFQKRPLHLSLQKSKRSIRDEEFTASSFSHLDKT